MKLTRGCDDGSDGRAFASDTKGPRFESHKNVVKLRQK